MKERFFSMRILIYVSLTILVLSGITYIVDALQLVSVMKNCLNAVFENWGLGITVGGLTDLSGFDLLLSQISNTFIVLSLTVVLSTNVGYVYWIDIKDHKLVEPVFSCFIAIMTYLLSNLGFSIVVYFLGEHHSLLISFLVSIILLMWLSYKMISVYFGRSRMKRRLMLEYVQNKWMVDLYEIGSGDNEHENANAIESYGRALQRIYNSKWLSKQFDRFLRKWDKTTDKEKRMQMAEDGRRKLQTYEEGIRENSIRALNEGNKDIIEENIHLLAPMDSNKSVLRLLSEIDVTNPGYAAILLYQLYKEGNYNPGVEEVRVYAKTLMEQLIESGCAPESIYNMSKLLGDLDGKKDYFEILQHAMDMEDVTAIEQYIVEKVIPLYDNELDMNCYKLVDELLGVHQERNRTALDKYCNHLIWIKNKLEQDINAASIELALKVNKYPLMMRKIHFFTKEEFARLEEVFGEECEDIFSQLATMNIYLFVDHYIVSNMDELMEAQSKYEKLRSIFGAKNSAVLRARTKLALAYNETKDYQSTCNLYETNRAEILDDETEVDLSYSTRAVALGMCGYVGDAWNIAYELYNKYKQRTYDYMSDARIELIYRNLADVLYSFGQYEWALNFDERIFLKHSTYDEAAVLAYHRMVIDASAWKKKAGNENVLRRSYLNRITVKEWEEAYIRCKVVLGEEHNTTLNARTNYTMNRTDISEEERIEEIREIYQKKVELFGEYHPNTTSARLRLARQIAENSPIEEIKHYRAVYDIRKRVLGELHPDTIHILFSCWRAYIQRENGVLATLYKNKVEKIESGIESVNNQIAFMRIKALIDGYSSMGNQEKVFDLYQLLYQKQKEVYGDKSPLYVDTMNNIAYEYANAKVYKKTAEYFDLACEEAYKIRDLAQMQQAKLMSGLYRVKQQFPNDTTSSGYELIRKYYESRINRKNSSEVKRLMQRVNFFVIKGNEGRFHNIVKSEWGEIYKSLQELSGDYAKEMLLVLYCTKCIYEQEKNEEYVEQLQKLIDEILETLDNL